MASVSRGCKISLARCFLPTCPGQAQCCDPEARQSRLVLVRRQSGSRAILVLDRGGEGRTRKARCWLGFRRPVPDEGVAAPVGSPAGCYREQGPSRGSLELAPPPVVGSSARKFPRLGHLRSRKCRDPRCKSCLPRRCSGSRDSRGRSPAPQPVPQRASRYAECEFRHV